MISSIGGDDTLTVGAGSVENRLYGDAFSMFSSTGGNDILTGGANSFSNALVGDVALLDASLGGNDILTGGANSRNDLVGDAITAQNGAVGGDDRLVSGTNATDYMWGDFQRIFGSATGGNDTFVFGPDNGTDYIYDFHKGEDTIELSGFDFPPIPDTAWEHMPAKVFSHVLEKVTGVRIETVGADTVIHFDDNNSVTIFNVTNLSGSNFDFVA
jgi:hypothetical protein